MPLTKASLHLYDKIKKIYQSPFTSFFRAFNCISCSSSVVVKKGEILQPHKTATRIQYLGHVMTTEWTPSADEDCEMQLKAPKNLLFSRSWVIFFLLGQTTVSKNELSQCTSSPVSTLLIAWLPSCFRYCL